jgi:hypothetical protein
MRLQDKAELRLAGFVHPNGLETAVQGPVFLNETAVFVFGRGNDASHLTPRQRALQEIRQILRSAVTNVHKDMGFVDKQDDALLSRFLQEAFDPLEEFPVINTRHKARQRKGHDPGIP